MSGKKSCTTNKSLWQQDYRSYRFSKREWLRYAVIGFALSSLLLYFFYQSLYVLLPGIPCAIFFCRWRQRQLCRQRKQRLQQQFKDWINGVASALQTGCSVENAFVKAGGELRLLYGEESDIRREIHNMEHLLANNITLERILEDFADRAEIGDISSFVEVFRVGKRSGGNLREMIESCCQVIVMKGDVEREIRTMIHGKLMEQRLMCLVPFGIISYISISSPGYFAPLYHNPAGVCIMTGCLLLYLFSVWLSLRIVRIEV